MLKYALFSHPWRSLGFDGKAKDDLRNRGAKLHRGLMSYVGWWRPVDGRKVPIGLRDRLDVSFVNWAAPCFAADKSGLGSEVCALSEMVGHVSSPRDFFAPPDVSGPGMAGLRNCESPFTHLQTQKAIAEGYCVPHFLRTQQAFGRRELNDAYTLPGVGNTVG